MTTFMNEVVRLKEDYPEDEGVTELITGIPPLLAADKEVQGELLIVEIDPDFPGAGELHYSLLTKFKHFRQEVDPVTHQKVYSDEVGIAALELAERFAVATELAGSTILYNWSLVEGDGVRDLS
ncbi:MAG TPA: hypothetical protein VGF75_00185 [Candidatus Saccharimonadales bacterium]|jgi:hypothetical protein